MIFIPEKKPAFFPFVSAEVFFEADAQSKVTLETLDSDLDAELDEILSTQ